MSFESHLRPWIDPEEPLESYQGHDGNGEWIFDEHYWPEEATREEWAAEQRRMGFDAS